MVAIGGASLALFIASTVSTARDLRSKNLLMLVGAIAFGLAVWSMHFIGMLAFELCTSVSYNSALTFLSALPAVLAAWVVLHQISRQNNSFLTLLLGGLITGAGIGLMHYSGMMAMRMSATLRFDPFQFFISIAAAVILATLALWARNGLIYQAKIKPRYANTFAAVVMGLAIAAMHYLGMAAARFIGMPQTAEPIAPTDWFYLAMLITMGIVSILGFVGSGVFYMRLKESLATIRLHKDELDTIIQNSTEAIITAHADGAITSINLAFKTIFGYLNKEIAGDHLSTFLPEWPILIQQKVEKKSYETLGRREDGSEFPIRVTLYRIDRDELAVYMGFLTDLSDIKKIQDKLIHDANHDFLTGLSNRRYFLDQLQLELERTKRTKSTLSLIMLDIDHFKRINDEYGHLCGDHVLKVLANEIKKLARSGDVVSRYGGEEFILLLPNTDLAEAKDVAERLRVMTAKLKLKSDDAREIQFTVSLGVTCNHKRDLIDCEILIGEADRAMYRAKNSGRNRVKEFLDWQ
ncbi:diguanylate cyclase domain-containing protein [Polynucleobacter sp. AP-Reno-20A-A9]|uniref:sensor domain-containing diguanylate cyclase n=1 Tax=Polynucleobacter sp. AP-Reno-20A-A9 TaxID=2576925 RepID=UPI001C0DA5E1|nr:diguanylate cyclase [Polynucleobacter sp. AP-Reno-20A-A9]MBU3628852.1 diguanylate cyclase [Polynucleobacter sp. AP-Reno-20A-A9]